MLTIFNRAELFLTMHLKQQADLRAALTRAGIDYTLRVSGSNNIDFPHSGSSRGANYKTYQFFVHKKDLEAAQAVLRSIL